MASERRLIDAEELWKKFESEPWYENADRDEIALPMVDDAPAVDAVEVVHGRWEDEYGGAFTNPRYRCSVCKGKALYRHEKNSLGGWEAVQALTDYCPNCGAKMDGERTDNNG